MGIIRRLADRIVSRKSEEEKLLLLAEVKLAKVVKYVSAKKPIVSLNQEMRARRDPILAFQLKKILESTLKSIVLLDEADDHFKKIRSIIEAKGNISGNYRMAAQTGQDKALFELIKKEIMIISEAKGDLKVFARDIERLMKSKYLNIGSYNMIALDNKTLSLMKESVRVIQDLFTEGEGLHMFK